MRTRVIGLATFLAVGLTACSALRRGTGFDDVQRVAGTRNSPSIHWYQGTPADREVEEQLKTLLASELTPDSAVQIALFNNRSLQATFERIGIAQADLVQAGLLPNPIVHLGLRLPINAPGASAELSLLEDFIRALQIPLRKRVAAAAFEATKLEVADAVIDLTADVTVAFYTLQGAEQMLDLHRTVVQAMEYSAELAARQREAGNIPDLDLANELSLFEQTRLDLARAEEDVLASREELNALLGVWGADTGWTVAPRLPDPPRETLPSRGLESLAVSQRLDLAAVRQEIEQQARAVGLARFEAIIPAGDIGADAEREPEGEWTVGPAIELPIPVFDQGQAAVANVSGQLRQARARYRALAVQIRADVRRTRTRAEAARRRSVHYRAVVLPLRRRVVDQTQLQYNAMQVGAFQLLQAKRDEIEAGRGYVESLTEFWSARAELERALGGKLGTSPGTPPSADVPAEPEEEPGGHHPQRHGNCDRCGALDVGSK